MFKNLLEKFRKNKLPPVLAPQLMQTHARLPVSFTRGQQDRLWDVDGNEYLDAGTHAAILGHAHPSISEAISLQADRLLYVGNRFHSNEQAELAKALCAITGLEKVHLCDSPAAAYVAAFELLAKAGLQQGKHAIKVLTLAEQAASVGKIAGIELETIEFDDIDSIGRFASDAAVFAVLLPSLHCAVGAQRCTEGYLSAVRDLCEEHSWLLVLDESLTGLGRTGAWFAYQHEHVQPDVVIGPAALGNGLAIGSLCARGDVANVFQPSDSDRDIIGNLADNSGGNPLVCKVALATIDAIRRENLLANAACLGAELKRKIKHHIGTLNGVVDIRGNGLFLVIELETNHAQLAEVCLMQGLVADVLNNGRYIRLTPPISISQQSVVKLADKLSTVLSEL